MVKYFQLSSEIGSDVIVLHCDDRGVVFVDEHRTHFKVQEFVPEMVYRKYGPEKCLKWFINPEVVLMVKRIREYFEAPIIGNDWYTGGRLNYRGYRPVRTNQGAKYSQHGICKAFDFNVRGKSAGQVFTEIVDNQGAFWRMGVRVVEDIRKTPTWTHVDIRYTGLINKLLTVE